MKDRDTTGMYGTIPTYHYVHTVMRECGFVATHTSYVMCSLLLALVAGLGMVGTIVVCALHNYSAAFQLCYIIYPAYDMVWYGGTIPNIPYDHSFLPLTVTLHSFTVLPCNVII